MKAMFILPCRLLALLVLLAASLPLYAEIEVRLSVKFILHPNGTRPSAADGPISISNVVDFIAEVDHGNRALAFAARGFKLRAVEFLDIHPSAPSGQPADYWFNLAARDERQTIETAALADTTTWRWHAGAINIYINNSSSGSCSFIGNGSSISMGATIFTQGTIVHEIGHFFNLSHTHAGDPPCPGAPPYFVANGDNLVETINDHACLTDRDWLSQSNFNGRVFANLTPAEQAQVNSSWLNVMSYHVEERFLPDQMDRWTTNANNARLFACLGRTWFVAPFGSDANPGVHPSQPFVTIPRAQQSLGGVNDVILMRAGIYAAPLGNRLATPATFCATRGSVTIFRP